MKKEYIIPSAQVVSLFTGEDLLINSSGNGLDGDGMASQERQNNWDSSNWTDVEDED